MSFLEGTRKDLFFSDISPEELQELQDIDPTMNLDNWHPKKPVFDSPDEEVKWRTEKLLKDIDGFAWMKPEAKPAELAEFKQRVEQAIADAATMDQMADEEFTELWQGVRKLSEEMKQIQYRSKQRMWAMFEEMEREFQADPDYFDKLGVTRNLSDDEDDEEEGVSEDEEDIESSDGEEWVNED